MPLQSSSSFSIPHRNLLHFSSHSNYFPISSQCNNNNNNNNSHNNLRVHIKGRRNINSKISLGTSCCSLSVSPSTTATTISSPSNPFIKHCLKLRQNSSYRHFHRSVLVVGLTPIREILRFQELQEKRESILDCLLLLDGIEVPEELYNSCTRMVHVSSIVMKKLSGMQSIDSVEAVAIMRIPSSFCNIDDNQEEANCRSWFPSPHRILVLDSIQDPGNLGTLLRSAMAFKWDGVFLLSGCCDPFNEKAVRAARGASFQLPIISGNWVHLDALRKNFQIKMLAGHPENTEEEKYTSILSPKLVDSLTDDHICLVLGSEGHGLSEKSKLVCELVSIPMAGKFESLNVSVAGGIFLFMLQPKHQRVH